jgi:hypothetical protein
MYLGWQCSFQGHPVKCGFYSIILYAKYTFYRVFQMQKLMHAVLNYGSAVLKFKVQPLCIHV